MMSKFTKVQIIGNYMTVLKDLLYRKNIEVENIISNCNPLAMVGTVDHQLDEHESKCSNSASLLMMRKNLKNVLSHDRKQFCENNINQPIGEEVRYANRSEWLIISNNLMGYGIYQKDDYIYSDTWPDKELTAYLKDIKSGYKRFCIPYPGKFNWKYYYDMFIEAVLKEYSPERIILLKTSASQWYLEDDTIKGFEDTSLKYRRFIEEADDYFIEKTNCKTIDTMYSFIAANASPCAFVYSQRPQIFFDVISDEITNIINNSDDNGKKYFYNPSLRLLKKYLKDSVYKKYDSVLESFESKWSSINDIIIRLAEVADDSNLLAITDFVTHKYIGLSEYISVDKEKINFKVINAYCKYIKLDINDIIALYMMSKERMYISEVNVALSILNENDSLKELVDGQRRYKRNIRYLSNYPYIDQNLLEFEHSDVILFLDEKIGLKISVGSDIPFCIVRYDKEMANAEKILNEGMKCTVEQAFSLCSNWKFYINRSKKGMKDVPVSIIFKNKEEFAESLYYIDYVKLLSNERFVIRLNGSQEKYYEDYKGIVDLDFLFLKNVGIFHVRLGLADQLCYYAMAEYMREKKGLEIYFDDVYCRKAKAFNGLEFPKLVAQNVSDRLISSHLSEILSQNMEKQLADIFYNNGIDDLVAIVPYEGTNNSFIKDCPKLLIKGTNYAPVINANFRIIYSSLYVKPEAYFEDFYKYIKFPAHSDPINIEIENNMKNSDAVVIHIRRGDYVTWGWDTDMDFYKESLEKLEDIDDYKNKKYFIFSDDIPWCRNNLDAIGLSEDKGADITFVDNNKGGESFRDMQLMSNAKVMIASNSGFVRMAALISRTCEVFMCYNLGVIKIFENNIRKNKYDVGPYKKKYSTDYKSRSPKTNK